MTWKSETIRLLFYDELAPVRWIFIIVLTVGLPLAIVFEP